MFPIHRNAPVSEEQKEEQLTELLRVVASAKADEFGTLADKHGEVAVLIEHLGRKAIRRPGAHASEKELYNHVTGIPISTRLKQDHSNKVNTLRGRAITFVKKYYRVHPPLKFRLSVLGPQGDDRGNPEGAFGVEFKEVATAASPAVSLWWKMIEPINPAHGLLIYPNENKEIETAEIRSRYSGLGEVAAGLMIGLRAAFLSNEPEPRPCKAVSPAEIALSNSWFVFLGSHPSNTLLDDLSNEHPWRELQHLRFMKPKDDESSENVPVICRKGPPGPDGEPTQEVLWSHKRATGMRSHEEEYALISYLHDEEISRVIIICAGMSTIGTWAAADFLCKNHKVEILQKVLQINPDDYKIPSFQVVLKVEIHKTQNFTTSVEKAYRSPAPGKGPVEIYDADKA